MNKYKIKLTYTQKGTPPVVVSVHDVVDVVVNAQDWILTYARQKLYEGLFVGITDTLQFTDRDKAYIDGVFEQWQARMTAEDTLLCEIEIYNSISLQFEKRYSGTAEWESITANELITEVLFTESTNTSILLQNEAVDYEITGTDYLKSFYLDLLNEFNADHVIRYVLTYTYLTFPLNNQYHKLLGSAINAVEDGSINEFYTVLDDVTVLSEAIDEYVVNWNVNAVVSGLFSVPITFGIGGILDVVFSLRMKSGASNYVPIYDVSFTVDADLLNSIDVNVNNAIGTLTGVTIKAELEHTIECKFEVTQGGLPVIGFEQANLTYNVRLGQEDYVFGYWTSELNRTYNINVLQLDDVLNEFNNKLKLNIDNTVIGSLQINNLHFMTGGSLLQQSTIFSQSYSSFFEELKKVAAVGLQLDINGLLSMVSLSDMYDRSGIIIDLGEATDLNYRINEELIYNNLLLGAGARDKEDEVAGHTSYVNYNIVNSVTMDENKQFSAWKADASYINQRFLELYYNELKNAQEVMPIFTLKNDPDIVPTTPILSGKVGAFGGNAEFGVYKILQTWRDILATNLNGVEDLVFGGGDINKEAVIQDNLDGIQTLLTSEQYNIIDAPFGGLQQQIFGVLAYDIQLAITPRLQDTIGLYPNNRYKVSYKGTDYVFYLRNIDVKLLSDSEPTIKAWEAFNKV